VDREGQEPGTRDWELGTRKIYFAVGFAHRKPSTQFLVPGPFSVNVKRFLMFYIRNNLLVLKL
jgi:hypothetical protein